MNVANLDPQKSMADQMWDPAQLRIILDESGVYRTYRLTVCRGNSLLTDHLSGDNPSPSHKGRINDLAVQPASAKIVLNYAFNTQPPAIWFEHSDESVPLCFSPRDPGMTGLRSTVLAIETLHKQ